MPESDNSLIIIGAGFAGLAAGIYGRLNGYNTQVFEAHYKPGGLCTSWIRKGYTFDGCIHWLVGSAPGNGLHDLWEDTGIARGRKFIDLDEYMRLEDTTGRTLILYTDIDRLEEHLLEFSPQDEIPIREFTDGIRMCQFFDPPSRHDSLVTKVTKQVRTFSSFMSKGKKMQYWMKTSCATFSDRFKDPLLKEAFREMWVPEFSMFFVLFTFAYLHKKNAGYPIGGSLPMSEALAARYKELGGKLFYNKKVSKIVVTNGKATGIILEDGTIHNASRVISAADGHETIYSMLGGKYGDDSTHEPYKSWTLFPSLIYASFGVNRTFGEEAKTVSGFTFQLKEPIQIGDKMREKLSVRIYNHDPTLAPPGKTCITVMMDSDYDYWKNIALDKDAYLRKKEEISQLTLAVLESRFPGISKQVDVTDVATPLTFKRYTGNWKGSFEGWLLTPMNYKVLLKPMSQTIPGLSNFYMCGQWVEPGGGLPTVIMSGRRLIKKICREDDIKFRT